MKNLSKKELSTIEAEIQEALNSVGSKHNISFAISNVKADDKSLRINTKGYMVDESATIPEDSRKGYAAWKAAHDVPFDLDQKFTFRNREFKVAGFKQRNRKYPILAQDSVGRVQKMQIDTVKSAIKK